MFFGNDCYVIVNGFTHQLAAVDISSIENDSCVGVESCTNKKDVVNLLKMIRLRKLLCSFFFASLNLYPG